MVMLMVMVMVITMMMPVLSDIVLLIIAFISLYLALEIFKPICSIKCWNNAFQFYGLYCCICVTWGNCIGRERVKLTQKTIDFLGTKWRWHLIQMTLFDSNLFDLYWTRRVRWQLVIMHKLRPPAHIHLLYFNITCQRDLLKCHGTFITFSIHRQLLKAIIGSDISVYLHLRAPEMEVWRAARPCRYPSSLRRLMSYIYIWSTHSWCF